MDALTQSLAGARVDDSSTTLRTTLRTDEVGEITHFRIHISRTLGQDPPRSRIDLLLLPSTVQRIATQYGRTVRRA